MAYFSTSRSASARVPTTSRPCARAEQVLGSGELTDLLVWEFANAQVKETTATIDFKVKVFSSHGEAYLRCTATFVLDSDGEWRLGSYQVFDAMGNRELHF